MTAGRNVKRNGVIAFLDQARKDGKIVNAGFSFHGATEDFYTIVDDYDWVFCQIQYNILDKYNQAGIHGLEYAVTHDLAVMIMGTSSRGKHFQEDFRRKSWKYTTLPRKSGQM